MADGNLRKALGELRADGRLAWRREGVSPRSQGEMILRRPEQVMPDLTLAMAWGAAGAEAPSNQPGLGSGAGQ